MSGAGTHRIVIDEAPDADVREAVLAPLRDYNRGQAGDGRHGRFALRLERDGETLEGGLFASHGYDWCYVDLLVVPDALRGTGVGSDLMAAAEEEARRRGCVGIWLTTFSFQAKPFYESLGFREFGRLDDHPVGHSCHYLHKRLDTPKVSKGD